MSVPLLSCMDLPLCLVIAVTEVPDSSSRHQSGVRRRVRSELGRNLACEAASRLHHRPAIDFRVAGGGTTPPVLTHYLTPAQETAISISHSGKWVCAVAARRQQGLGIDVQAVEPHNVEGLTAFMNWTGLLAPPAIDAGRDAGSDVATALDKFTHLWTVWEAAVKCDGVTVLAGSTRAFDALAPHCRPGTEHSWSAGTFWAHSQRLDDLHWLTVVSAGPMTPTVEGHFVEAQAVLAGRA